MVPAMARFLLETMPRGFEVARNLSSVLPDVIREYTFSFDTLIDQVSQEFLQERRLREKNPLRHKMSSQKTLAVSPATSLNLITIHSSKWNAGFSRRTIADMVHRNRTSTIRAIPAQFGRRRAGCGLIPLSTEARPMAFPVLGRYDLAFRSTDGCSATSHSNLESVSHEFPHVVDRRRFRLESGDWYRESGSGEETGR
jgi:hypothetical protein